MSRFITPYSHVVDAMASRTTPPAELVRDSLDFLGYGSPESRFWFFEYEESMYDHERYAGCETLTDVLKHRRQYGEFIDFEQAWTELSDYPVENFAGYAYTWLYEVAFLFGARGAPDIKSRDLHRFAFEDARLGRRDGDNFSCEARPLPKSDVGGTGPYAHVWPSVEAYHRDVKTRRQRQMQEYLVGNEDVEWIVLSGKNNLMKDVFASMFELREVESWDGENSMSPYVHHEMYVADDQTVNVVFAPFFGQGRTSYRDVAEAGCRFVHQDSV